MIVSITLGNRKRARFNHRALFPFLGLLVLGMVGCSLFHDRPIQLMSDTSAAIKAAKEVSADSLAPEKFRLSNEAFFRAQNEYRLKNFEIAEKYAKRAKRLAEESEFDALRQGSNRASLLPPEVPVGPPPKSTYEAPQGILATEAMKQQNSTPSGSNGTGNGSGASSGGSSGAGAGTYPQAAPP